jgi:hypothetical protein
MLLSKTKTRKVSAPVSETVSADAPPPCAAEPNVPAAAGLDGRNGARGTLGSGRELVRVGRAVFAGFDLARLEWATTTCVKVDDSSRTSVRFGTTLCLRTNDGCLAGGPVCGVPTACEVLSSTGLRAGEVVGTTPVSGTTPASSRCTSTVGGGGIDGIVKTGIGGGTAGIDGSTGGGGSAGCATGCDVATALDEEALEAALVAARFDWFTSPSFPGLAIRIETATLHWTQTDGTAAAGAGAPAGQSHCQFQIQIVAPAGGAGTAGAELGSQFQLQFQIQTSGGVTEPVFGASGVILLELLPAVLPPVSAPTGPVGAVSGAGPAETGPAGRGAAPVGAPCATVFPAGAAVGCGAPGRGAGDGSAAGAPADTTGGIAGEITFSGLSDAVGAAGTGTAGASTTTVGSGGAGGSGTTTAGGVTGGGMTGALTPPEAKADGEATAPSASAATMTALHLATLPSRRALWSIYKR